MTGTPSTFHGSTLEQFFLELSQDNFAAVPLNQTAVTASTSHCTLDSQQQPTYATESGLLPLSDSLSSSYCPSAMDTSSMSANNSTSASTSTSSIFHNGCPDGTVNPVDLTVMSRLQELLQEITPVMQPLPFSSSDERWAAIESRSHEADRHFLYGTVSTNIVCRPSCPSKRPSHNHVRYFANPGALEEAIEQGYRPCKRCQPNTESCADIAAKKVSNCLAHLARAAMLGEGKQVPADCRQKTLTAYAKDADISPFHFHRTFEAICNVPLARFYNYLSALYLQDFSFTLRDPNTGQPVPTEHIPQYANKKARRLTAKVSLAEYRNMFVNLPVFRIVAKDTPYGEVCVLITPDAHRAVPEESSGSGVPKPRRAHSSRDDSTSSSSSSLSPPPINNYSVLGVFIGPGSTAEALRRAPLSQLATEFVSWLSEGVKKLAQDAKREVQLPDSLYYDLRRVRIYDMALQLFEPELGPKKRRSGQEAH